LRPAPLEAELTDDYGILYICINMPEPELICWELS